MQFLKAIFAEEIKLPRGTLYLIMVWAFLCGGRAHWTEGRWWSRSAMLYFAFLAVWTILQLRRHNRGQRTS
jgi:hypothetical protein